MVRHRTRLIAPSLRDPFSDPLCTRAMNQQERSHAETRRTRRKGKSEAPGANSIGSRVHDASNRASIRPWFAPSGLWLPWSGFPGALPQANLCCPVGAKSTAWRTFHNQQRSSLIRHCEACAARVWELASDCSACRGNPEISYEKSGRALDCRSRLGSFAMTTIQGKSQPRLELSSSSLATGTGHWNCPSDPSPLSPQP